MDISVIISTSNRCESLRDTLESLLRAKEGGNLDYEIIIVDNNSNDRTKEVIESYIPKFQTDIRYFFEPKQGKTYALNRGIKEAKGDILVFTDDDVMLDTEWLLNTWKCFREHSCDGIGGRIVPLYPKNAPKWIIENIDILAGPLVRYDYGTEIEPYNDKAMLPFVGANMAFRKECFENFGLFRTDLGPGLGTLGDETEFFKRIKNSCKALYYCGKAIVWHKVDIERANLLYIAKWYKGYGRYSAIMDQEKVADNFVCYFGVPRYLFKKIAKNIVTLVLRTRDWHTLLINWMALFWNIGKISQYRVTYKRIR